MSIRSAFVHFDVGTAVLIFHQRISLCGFRQCSWVCI